MSATVEHTTPGLRRVIRLPHATAMVVGTIIGASIFVQPSEITGQVPSIPALMAVWVVSGVLTLFGALVCAELASTFTRSGGVYVYLRESFSPAVGFLWGWAMYWTMHSGIIAAIAVVFVRYTSYFVSMSDGVGKAVAIGVIIVLSTANYVGVKHGTQLQTMFTFGKLVAIGFIIVVGFVLGRSVPEHFAGGAQLDQIAVGDFLSAVVAGLFAFGGWHMVTYNAEETVDSRRTIPKALMWGIVIVTGSYVALNAVYLYVLPVDVVATSTRVAADAADALIGTGGGAFMSALVMFSTFGALSGIVLAGPRVYFAMAQDGLLFRWAAAVHPRFRTPHRAIVLQAVWASVLVATGTYRALFTRVIYTEWLFFGLMAIGLVLLRRRPGLTREYRIWGYPYVPLIFAISSFIILGHQFVTNVRDSSIGLLIVLAGLPVYYWWSQKLDSHESAA